MLLQCCLNKTNLKVNDEAFDLILSLWTKSCCATIRMKPLQQHFYMVLVLYLVLAFEYMDKILWSREV